MNNLQTILDSIKGNVLFCTEAIEDIQYGLDLGSTHAVQSHFEIWLNSLDNISESSQDADYYRTIKWIHEHNGVIN